MLAGTDEAARLTYSAMSRSRWRMRLWDARVPRAERISETAEKSEPDLTGHVGHTRFLAPLETKGRHAGENHDVGVMLTSPSAPDPHSPAW